MWKIFIEYDDKSKLTLTGQGKDISLRLAVKYYNDYVAGRKCKAIYQRYPKKCYGAVELADKIEHLQNDE